MHARDGPFRSKFGTEGRLLIAFGAICDRKQDREELQAKK